MSEAITWTTTHGDTVEVYGTDDYDDRVHRWRYRVRAANNKIVEWGEGYTRRIAAVNAALRHHPRFIAAPADPSEVAAAQLLIKMLEKDGEPVDADLRAIAEGGDR